MSTDAGRALRYVIIGSAGAVAEKHAHALGRLPAQIVGMCDVDEARGRARATRASCAFSRDAAALLDLVRPDVAVICTPHPSHAAIARACLTSGVHVLLEKPIAVEIAEADELVALSDQGTAVLAVSFGERFLPAVEHARTVITRGDLGRVLRVAAVEGWRRDPSYYGDSPWRGTWRGEGGGVLMNQAPHLLDLLCHLLGSPRRVWGITRTAKHAIECEDTAHAMFEYPGGAVGHLAVSTAEGHTERRIEIAGERAVLTCRRSEATVVAAGSADAGERAGPPPAGARPGHAARPTTGAAEAQLAIHLDLRRAILEGTPPRCDARDGRMSLELANAIMLSSALERAVQLPLDRGAYSAFLRARRGG